MLKIKCFKKDLTLAVLNVQRAVSVKSTIDVLEGIKLKTNENNLYLFGYNLELGIKTSLSVTTEEEGDIVVNAKLFSEIIRKLPDNDVSIEVSENNSVLIESGDAKFTINGISCEEFPSLPELEDTYDIEIGCDILKSMISQTIYAISTNEIKPLYTGSLFEINNNEIKIISLDGCRIAIRKETIKTNNDNNKKFVVPGKTLSEIVKLLDDVKEKVKISVDIKHVSFQTDNYYIVSRLLNGDFMDYNNPIPKNEDINTKVEVSVESFIDSIDRVSLLISDNIKNPIKCLFDSEENMIKISSVTAMGRAKDKIVADIKGNSFEMGFNKRYLIDALRYTDTDKVLLEIKDSYGPMKITPIKDDSFLFLVLPVRIN